MRVAAVQGNIAQSIKWQKDTLPHSAQRYASLTEKVAPLHPQLVVWPETVITTDLNDTAVNWNTAGAAPAQRDAVQNYLSENAALIQRFSSLAKRLGTTLTIGSLDRHWSAAGLNEYNALYTWGPSGRLENIYDKRQLVPFVENLPARSLFAWLPHVELIGRFQPGEQDTVLDAGGMKYAPLICWESAFADLIHAQIQRGAQFLVIATDDAWFGESSGTYQHAQIAQMRAIESGEWVVQAASTGISGIIAPDGRWVEATPLDKEAVVLGSVGLPAGSLFARIGPDPVTYGAAALYVVIVLGGLAYRRRSAARIP